MVPKADKSQQLSVCLLSAHPLVFTQFQNVLAGSGIRLTYKQLPADSTPYLQHEDIPAADAYVVDAHAAEIATLLKSVLSRWPSARLLVVGEKFNLESSYVFLQEGVKGLLTYGEAETHLAKALSQVTAGGFWVPRTVLSSFVDHILSAPTAARASHEPIPDLSLREQQVLDTVLQNLSNKEIASKLHMSERTVKFHVSRLLEKFQVHRRADLIVLWYQRRK